MRISRLVPTLAVVAALAISSNALAVSYQYDDGTPGALVGFGPGTMWWGNVFTVEPGGEMITSLKYMVGFSPTFHALLYSGNPMTGLTLVHDITVPTTPLQWQEVDIPDTVMNGDFFVAAMAISDGNTPAVFGVTPTTDKSMEAFGPSLNPVDPIASSETGILQIPYTWLIRANGTSATNAVPEPLTLCGLMLSACGLVSYVRKRRLAA